MAADKGGAADGWGRIRGYGGIRSRTMPADFAETQRQVRLACAPEPGAKGAIHHYCLDCGAGFWDWLKKWRYRCADCSAERARQQRADPAAWLASRRGC